MSSEAEVRESHEQFCAAWSLYARCSREGEVVNLDGLCIANARQPWLMMNAALLTSPVSSPVDLAARADAAIGYFGGEGRPWFFAGGRQWLRDDAAEILAERGLVKAFSVVGMVTDQLTPLARPLPNVETRRIDDESGRQALAELNADAYDIAVEWVHDVTGHERLWHTPLYGYNAYVDGHAAATAIAVPQNGVLYVGWVATAATHRRRGLAELVMRRCLERASEDTGITRTALHATADGYPGYIRMGYRPIEEFDMYVPQSRGAGFAPVASNA